MTTWQQANGPRMARIFPTSYSSPEKHALLALIRAQYKLDCLSELKFLRRGLNDTYLIEADERRFIFRLYRTWRSAEDVEFELEWLDHLAAHNVPVVPAIRLFDQRRFGSLRAAEGIRCYALFPHAGEMQHPPVDRAFACLMGESLALLHRASDDFVSAAQRFRLDPAHLIEQPLRAIHQLFFRDRDALTLLDGIAAKVTSDLQTLSLTPPIYGPCHGDVHFENFCRLRSEPLWLDFDCGGLGWRVYDVATFYWALKLKWVGWSVEYADSDDAIWPAFVDAYQVVRGLSSEEWRVFPAFVIARTIWGTGLQASNGDDWAAHAWLTSPFFAEGLKFIRQIAADLDYDLPGA
jgi:Ser/Thr protein kinase RdoA (MazF antagonist)